MTDETNEPVVDEVEPPAPDRRSVTLTLPSAPNLLRALAAVLVLALIATVVIESVHIHNLSRAKSKATLALLQAQAGSGVSLDATSASAVTAATTYAQEIATYNYAHLDQDFALTASHAVEPFLSAYQQETASIKADLETLKGASTGKVRSAGVVSVTGTTAVVDLFLDQTIVNSASKKPRLDTHRMTMTLIRVNGVWKIKNVQEI